MATIQELIGEVSALKTNSEELSEMLAYAGSNLQENTNAIMALVHGSRSGMEAAATLSLASKSLLDSAASIKTLGRTCDECIGQISK